MILNYFRLSAPWLLVSICTAAFAEQAFLEQAKALDHNALGIEGRVNAEVFEWVLEVSIGAHELNLKTLFVFCLHMLTLHFAWVTRRWRT